MFHAREERIRIPNDTQINIRDYRVSNDNINTGLVIIGKHSGEKLEDPNY